MPRSPDLKAVRDRATDIFHKLQPEKEAVKLTSRDKHQLEIELRALSDNELAQYAKDHAGEKRTIALGMLYDHLIDKIYSYLYYRMGNVQDAEDLTTRVFMKVLENIDNYENTGVPFSAWVYRIAHNFMANYHRDLSRRREQFIEDMPDIQLRSTNKNDPVRLVESVEAKRLLLEAIRRLPSDRQQLILLKFIDGLPNAQIGDIMGRSEGAIKSLYHRTLIALREELHDTI